MQGNIISKYKLESEMVPRWTAQIYKPNQGGKASLNFAMNCSAEEEKLGDGKTASFKKLIRCH